MVKSKDGSENMLSPDYVELLDHLENGSISIQTKAWTYQRFIRICSHI